MFRDESTTVLVFGHTSSKRPKVEEKVRTRYRTHEQRSDTMRGSTKCCQLAFLGLIFLECSFLAFRRQGV